MINIGCHLSSSKGYLNMGKETVAIGGSTFQFFTRNPRGGASKPLDNADIENYKKFAAEHNFAPIVAHAPYTMNPCAEKPEIREFTYNTMLDDLERLEHTPGALYNFHPGSHVGQGVETGINYIAETLSRILSAKEWQTTVLLETMAGKGSEVGSCFEEIKAIIDRTDALCGKGNLLGVCMDTCHVHDAGYDIVNDLDGVLGEFDRIIGISRLKAVHMNDSKNPRGARKDRHEVIGGGFIGLTALKRVANHPALTTLPFELETPHDNVSEYGDEIRLIRGEL